MGVSLRKTPDSYPGVSGRHRLTNTRGVRAVVKWRGDRWVTTWLGVWH